MASMDDFHCDNFEIWLRVKPKEMNAEAFLKALDEKGIATKPDADGDTEVALTFPGDKYHAHLTVNFWNSGRGRVELSYHSDKTTKGATAPASAEKCAQWLSGFFRDRVTTAHAHVNYTFDTSFTTTIGLPFPLVSPDNALAGSMVSGLELRLPNESAPAILQRIDDKIFIFLRNTFQLDLAEFNLFAELQRLSGTVSKLVKKSD